VVNETVLNAYISEMTSCYDSSKDHSISRRLKRYVHIIVSESAFQTRRRHSATEPNVDKVHLLCQHKNKKQLKKTTLRCTMTSSTAPTFSDNICRDEQTLSEQTLSTMLSSTDAANFFTSSDPEALYASADSVGSMGFASLGSTASAGFNENFSSIDAVARLFCGGSRVASQSFLAHLYASKDSSYGSKDGMFDTLSFKSLDTLPPSTDDNTPGMLPGIYESREWLSFYQLNHTDIDYTRNIFEAGESTPDTTMPSPVEQANSKWWCQYATTLANPMEVTPRVQTAPVVEQDKKAKKKCTSRCVDPKKKVYVKYTDHDILAGRGGKSNNHPGNEYYRATIEAAKPEYQTLVKYEKTILSLKIVEDMNKQGRRFLKLDSNGLWFEIPKMAARRKVGQALREENTPEARANKRQRYSKQD
jgi:hypothetical protein